MSVVRIGDRPIGNGYPSFIIGEVAQAHEGSLNMAHAYIDAIASAGADAVKFQTHIAAAESTPSEQFRVPMGQQDHSRMAYWKRMEFSKEQWASLATHAEEKGLLFLSSPFSIEAVELLERLGMKAWKVASGEITNEPILERMAETGIPILLSSGLSGWEELDETYKLFKERGVPLALFQCTTAYPTDPGEVGLNVMLEMRDRYLTPVGISDHSGTIFPALAATTLGANMIEVHVTLSRLLIGPDVDASVTDRELKTMTEGVRFIEAMLQNPVDKNESANKTKDLRKLFFHSVVAARDLPKGTKLAIDHLVTKKPGTGIPASRLEDLIGRELTRDVKADQLLAEEDLT